MSIIISNNPDDINRYNHPYYEFYDGTKTLYGKKNENGIFRINYDTTSRYGYIQHPIYAALVKKDKDDRYPAFKEYHFFIGECPHKNENDEWVTYNEVPNFIMGAFGGAHYIDAEPDIPHIIDIQTDEFYHFNSEKENENINKEYSEKYQLEQTIKYCTLSTYLKGLWNRIQLHIGKFSKYKSKNAVQYRYSLNSKVFDISFTNDKKSKKIYIWIDTTNWWRFLYFKKDGKWTLEYKKEENTGVYSSFD